MNERFHGKSFDQLSEAECRELMHSDRQKYYRMCPILRNMKLPAAAAETSDDDEPIAFNRRTLGLMAKSTGKCVREFVQQRLDALEKRLTSADYAKKITFADMKTIVGDLGDITRQDIVEPLSRRIRALEAQAELDRALIESLETALSELFDLLPENETVRSARR